MNPNFVVSQNGCELIDELIKLRMSGDTSSALKGWILEAQAGNSAAFVVVGRLYEDLALSDVDMLLDAVFWYKRAINLFSDPEAMIALAHIYYYGPPLMKDIDKANFLYKRALTRSRSNVQKQISALCLGDLNLEMATVKDCFLNRARGYYKYSISLGSVKAIYCYSELERREGNYVKWLVQRLRWAALEAYFSIYKGGVSARLYER